MKRLILLSGPVAVGKSSVARCLINQYDFENIRTGTYLKELALTRGIEGSRTGLQELGDSLDLETDYSWVLTNVAAPAIERNSEKKLWLFDCVRKRRQVEHFRARYDKHVIHFHLSATEALLRERYEQRLLSGGEYEGRIPYEKAIQHPNEISSRALGEIADFVADVNSLSADEISKWIYDKSEGGSDASSGTY